MTWVPMFIGYPRECGWTRSSATGSSALPIHRRADTKKTFPVAASTPEDILRFLLEQNNLTQYDIAEEMGGQPVVSDVLRGKRRLTREHIERLSARFQVGPATFYSSI